MTDARLDEAPVRASRAMFYCLFAAVIAASLLPPETEHCELGSYYGYRLYGREAQSRELGDAALCRLTVAKGFRRALILASAVRSRCLDCPGQQ